MTAHSPRAKRRTLSVGNLGVSTTDSSLAEFVISRAAKTATSVQVHSVNIFPQDRPTLFARILMDTDISALVLSREVWPRPLYCWKWHYVAPFKDKTQEAPSEGNDQEEAGTHSIARCSPPPCDNNRFTLLMSPESDWSQADEPEDMLVTLVQRSMKRSSDHLSPPGTGDAKRSTLSEQATDNQPR